MSDAGAYLTAGLPAPGINPGTGSGAVVSGYQFGPISAGVDSPLGGLFGFAQGISRDFFSGLNVAGSDFATGLNVAVNDPGAAAFVLHADPSQGYTDAQRARLAAAVSKGQSANPITAAGQGVGTILGTGIGTVGQFFGIAGSSAAPGVSAGAQEGVRGVTTVGAAGASGAFGGAIQGLGSGLATTLQQNSGDMSLIFVAAVVLVIILAAK